MSTMKIGNFTKSTYVEIEARQLALGEIIEEAKNRKQPIDENYLLYHMRLNGYEYSRSKLHNDRLALDSDNNYIRHFLPRYSRFQEEIIEGLNEIESQCIELGSRDWRIVKTIKKQTKDGEFYTIITEESGYRPKAEFLKIRIKIIELKMKHADGQNIQIGAVIIQKEFKQMKKKIQNLTEEKEQPKISDTITDESEKKK